MSQKPENVFVGTYFEPEEIERLREEVTRRGLNLIYHGEWLQPAAFPAEHNHNLDLTPEQWEVWIAGLKQADIMLDFEVNTLSRWVPENLTPRLRWLQATSAGVGQTIDKAGLSSTDLIVTTASGVHAQPLAEFVMLGLLMWIKQYPMIAQQQREKVWRKFATD